MEDKMDFATQLANGYRNISKIMSSSEWIAENGDGITHGTNEGYKLCKQRYNNPCQLCIDAAKAFSKEYRNRKEVKDRLYEYNRTNRPKTNKSRFEKYVSDNRKFNYFTANTVLATYGSDCHLCNKPIDLKAPRKSGMTGWELSLHIDHVIPLSKGGDDTLENVRPSHAQCNLRKSANFRGIKKQSPNP